MSTAAVNETLEQWASRVGTAFAIAYYRNRLQAASAKLAKVEADWEKLLVFLEESDFDEEAAEEIECGRELRIKELRAKVAEEKAIIDRLKNLEPVMGSGTDAQLEAMGVKSTPIQYSHDRLVEQYQYHHG